MKSKLITLIASLSLLALTSGCREIKKEYSEILHEDAVVAEVYFSPSVHGSGSGLGPTINFDGDIGIAITNVSINVPEKYGVLFKCQHGMFNIEGSKQEYKDLYSKLVEHKGDTVDVSYTEIWERTYEDIDKDGKKDLIKETLLDYDFLDANIKK